MLSRRRVLGALATSPAVVSPLIAPGRARAQSGKVLRLGTLRPVPPLSPESLHGRILVDALNEKGYAVGRNLILEARAAKSVADLAPQLEALKASHVDAVVVVGYPSALAAKASGVPTVIAWGAGDPVATGLVESWAHPGGTITGISDVAATLTAKRLEILKEFSPTLRRVAMLWNRDDLGMSLRYQASAETATSLGVSVQALGVREPDDFEEAFAAMNRERPDAILMVADALTVLNRKRVFDYAAAQRLPAIYEYDFLAHDGGLMSYGPDLRESLARTASMVDRIFRGARPGDLPFEQPTRYPFAINLKTAKAADFKTPESLLALADDVIE
jgi:putative tryptophan/tyrosine transport system substrate-binding protein